MAKDDKPKNMVEETDKEEEDAEKTGASSRKRGGKVHARKSGGKVPGKMPMGRPDRRARGGATSDTNPLTAAGNVSMPDYCKGGGASNGGGKGGDTKGGR